MTTKHEEQIGVALEHGVDGLALCAERSVESAVDDPVADHNGPAI